MQLHDLLADLAGFDGAGVLELRGPERHRRSTVEITSCHDSREAGPGALFCCIRGAVDRRASLRAGRGRARARSRCSWRSGCRSTSRRRGSARCASVLGPLAARFHGEPSFAMRVLGVTGTNGKTTTTYLLESIAAAAGDVAGVIGTVAAASATACSRPRTRRPRRPSCRRCSRRMRDDGVDTVAMEVSSHALDQHRVDATNFAATASRTSRTTTSTTTASVDDVLRGQGACCSRRVFTRRAAIQRRRRVRRSSSRGRAAATVWSVTRFAVDDPPAPTSDARAAASSSSPTGPRFDLVAVRRHAGAGPHARWSVRSTS